MSASGSNGEMPGKYRANPNATVKVVLEVPGDWASPDSGGEASPKRIFSEIKF